MYLSLNWLKDFVKIPNKMRPEELAQLLTLHTVEVESWQTQSDDFAKVVVGKVLSVKPHPNADRLRLCQVDVKKEILDIVCGAPNVESGQRVAVALVGATLPNGLTIKESEIRGEKSLGMICAEDELGLGIDHEGIMVLDKNAKIGQEFAAYLNLNDIILEIDNKSLSNRGDLWGHYGMAREISTLLKMPLVPYLKIDEKLLIPSGKEKISVKIEDKRICSRYIAVKINNVKIVESPNWLKEKLAAVNVRPINVLVDITNYVMFESGQPLHVFDAGKIQKISIGLSKKDEGIETLDGKEYLLPEDTIVIRDGSEPIAVAGIMGGANSAVNENTTSVILEAATFDAVYVRKSSQKLNLRTDASMRFEKTLDPTLPEKAWQKAWQLIKEILPEAELAGDIVDVVNFDLNQEQISLDFSWLKKKIGKQISRKEVQNILERLGFLVEINKNVLMVTPPSWRAVKDVTIKEDILEEVIRIIGYDNIPTAALSNALSFLPENKELLLERRVQDILSGSGRMLEVYNYSFVSESSLSKLNINSSRYLKLVNPISEQQALLRQSLLPGLLQNVRLNQFNYSEFGLFEIGRIFLPLPGEYIKDAKGDFLPYQGKRLGLMVAGQDTNKVFESLKSYVELLLNSLWPQIKSEYTALENLPTWVKSGQAAAIYCHGKEIGVVGLLDDKLANNFALKLKTAFAEINFKELLALDNILPINQYQESPKYPAVIRDLSFVVDEKMLYNDFWRTLISFHPLLIQAELFDIYQGDALGAGKKSWAFHLTYQSNDKTLTTEEVDLIQKELIQVCHDKFEAQIRNF
ncbi:MAG: phenylalanine--tRNA ligase subunit beta [Patescibacteria group bacterium]|nr:phenylalanine--tRNA ligase subunit beta [Patescibacteria group bacterium]